MHMQQRASGLRRFGWFVLALMLIVSMMPAAVSAAESTSRWEQAADDIDRLADDAFAYYLAGEAGKAYGNVSDAYFQIYEITGFERQTLSYISGPRKNAVELQFSQCKAAVKKEQ